jgi:mono/diheme cytochrome c family protein
MKKRKMLTIALIASLIGAAAGVNAQHKAGHYEAGSAGKIAQPLSQIASTDATYDVGPFLTYRPTLAPGDGSREVNVYCNVCHSPNYITMQPPLPADTWAAEVTKMQKTYGAVIPEEAAKKIVSYLQAKYTPDTRKH